MIWIFSVLCALYYIIIFTLVEQRKISMNEHMVLYFLPPLVTILIVLMTLFR